MKRIIAVLLFALAGCASTTTANYEKMLNTWIGADQDRLIANWGAPNNTYPQANGGHVLEFDRANTIYVPGTTYNQVHANYANGNVAGSAGSAYSPITTSGHTVTDLCKTKFTLNDTGHVVSWSWEGTACLL